MSQKNVLDVEYKQQSEINIKNGYWKIPGFEDDILNSDYISMKCTMVAYAPAVFQRLICQNPLKFCISEELDLDKNNE